MGAAEGSPSAMMGHRGRGCGSEEIPLFRACSRRHWILRMLSAWGLAAVLGSPFVACRGQDAAANSNPSPAPTASPRTSDAPVPPAPVVEIKTSMGTVVVELDPDKAPLSVANFLKYVADGHYDGTVIHRVVAGAMIQGGGFAKEGDRLVEKPTGPAIKSEADNGLKNSEGTIALARSDVPDTATAQFFINCRDNEVLDQTATAAGYAVFGRVIRGMDVVQQINAVRTGTRTVHGRLGSGKLQPATLKAVPLSDVIIESVRVVEKPSARVDGQAEGQAEGQEGE